MLLIFRLWRLKLSSLALISQEKAGYGPVTGLGGRFRVQGELKLS